MTYKCTDLTCGRFCLLVAKGHFRNCRFFCTPLGTILCMHGYMWSAKPRLRSRWSICLECVCVCVRGRVCVWVHACACVHVRGCMRPCVCVCHNENVPDEWQARQATPAILQVSSSKHNAKKITTRERGPFHQSITAILTEEKREEKQFT